MEVDAKSIDPDLEKSLRPYLCAFTKPDNAAGPGFPKHGDYILTEQELACYDTPEHGGECKILVPYP